MCVRAKAAEKFVHVREGKRVSLSETERERERERENVWMRMTDVECVGSLAGTLAGVGSIE